MKLKPLLIETLWLLTITAVSTLICYLLFGNEIFKNKLDINLHDTYFVTQSAPVIFTLAAIISFITYLIRASTQRYTLKPQNLITVVLGVLLIVLFSQLIAVLSYFSLSEAMNQFSGGNNLGNGWNVSPKLATVKDKNEFNFWHAATYILLLIQAVIVLSLCKVCYHWGKSKSTAISDGLLNDKI
ncbi:hypothetical protein [Pedobacter endophyticus]|uniref:DUF4149 domain-containing protein n=1 Tax=Pedobacter endophyticus TaxID=2789740 RepID=A0A7S9L395_9SPHI|nr:hypothetical protein [Pedobacter endophyticus]QPH41464.1 hypothetical protein IZT61_09490 [Pedobacter endophyticus]